MDKFIVWSLLAGATMVALTTTQAAPKSKTSTSERSGGPRGGPGGPGGPGRGMGRGPKMQLGRMWRGVGQLQGKSALSKDQARRLVALVRPWSSKPSMSDEQAKSLATQISAVLTPAQRSELDKMRPGGPGGPGGRDGGPGGPGGRGGRDGGPPPGERPDGPPPGEGRGGPPPGDFDPKKMEAARSKMDGLMKTMNPFYPPSKYASVQSLPEPMRRGMTRRYDESRQTLSSLARKAA